MFKTTKLCRGLALAFGGGLAIAALPALAQQQMERVEITGSSIKRVESETGLPVTVITREQIEKSGAINVEGLLARVSSSNAMQSDTTQGTGYAHLERQPARPGCHLDAGAAERPAPREPPLRQHRRLGAVDLNSIPFAAIERIEILRDGASAVYGTDAVRRRDQLHHPPRLQERRAHGALRRHPEAHRRHRKPAPASRSAWATWAPTATTC
jgi:iron complex outermembrane receptor protein